MAARVLATRKSVPVLDSHMSYLDTGKGGKVVIFLHGNPTQAYLWRNIIPHVQPVARCIAPDFIGMGQSGKIKSKYRFVDHYKYLSAWIDTLDLPQKLNFVVQDWGAALGFHWCNLHPQRVQSITFMECVVGPMFRTWDDFPEAFRQPFQALISPAGEELALNQNIFLEKMLPAAMIRELTKEELTIYQAPYTEAGESRRPVLTWAREMPISSGGPEDVCKITSDSHTWMCKSNTPKLYIHVEPGFFSPILKEKIKELQNTKMVTVKGLHFPEEDSPDDIGAAVHNFIKSL